MSRLARADQQIAARVDDVGRVRAGAGGGLPDGFIARVPVQYRADQIGAISLAESPEIQVNRALRHQRCAMTLHIVAPCRAPVDGTEMMLRIGFHCHRIPCVIAKPDQILAHTRVKRPVGRGAERIGQIEQPGGPIGKIKRAAMRGFAHCGHQRIGAEPRQHGLVPIDERVEFRAEAVVESRRRLNDHSGAHRAFKRSRIRHPPMQSAHAPQRSISPAGAAVLAYVDAGDFEASG